MLEMKAGESARECRYGEDVDKYDTAISNKAVRSTVRFSTGILITSFLCTHIDDEREENA